MNLEWKNEYTVGVKEIDDQHKKIIMFINELDNGIHGEDTKGVIHEIIINLNDYAKFHFSTEEKYFDQFNYEDKEEHTKRHRDYEVKVVDLEKKILELKGEDATRLAFEILDFLEDWWVNHILYEDKEYTELFNKNGLY